MKAACLVLSILVVVAIMAVCVMVKFATEITVNELSKEELSGQNIFKFTKSMGVISLSDSNLLSVTVAERFPYVAAITRKSDTTWSFACFASVILVKWVVTSAHCRKAGMTHRVLLYHDFVRNHSFTYPILFWRVHEKFNISNATPKYDIAVAKLDLELHPFTIKSARFDDSEFLNDNLEASVWKTVSTMDRKMFLTNDFDKLAVKIAEHSRCYESYGFFLDDSMFCVDMSDHEDCFIHEFGPIYLVDNLVGLIAIKPRECDMKLAVFTNVSYYTNWILKATRTTSYG